MIDMVGIDPDVARRYEHASDGWAALVGIVDSGDSSTATSTIASDTSGQHGLSKQLFIYQPWQTYPSTVAFNLTTVL